MADAASKPFKARAPTNPKKKKRKMEKSDKHELSLVEQMQDNPDIPMKNRVGKARKLQQSEEFVSSRITSRILQEARRQQLEEENERDEEAGIAAKRRPFLDVVDKHNLDTDTESEEEGGLSDTQSQYEDIEDVNEEDERILSMFMSKDAVPQRTLSDIIMDRIRQKNAELGDIAESGELRAVPGVDDKVLEVYRGVAKILSRYTTGKIPKAFKVLPSLSNWEELLWMTEPENWSPNAIYQATRLFASNLNARMAERFYNLVLLPRLRADIRTHKRLHFALYQALKKAIYKPSAFFKGILLSLCDSGTCVLREAVIIGSVLQKMTVPVLHSSVALMKIAQMQYSGMNSYFIKLFVDKKYALPYRVLDALVAHFVRFAGDERVLPVIWHQSLLSFVQRYKHELNEKDRCDLQNLLKGQRHYLVTPEIEREIRHGRVRGQKQGDVAISQAPFTTVMAKADEDVWNLPEVPIGMDED
eukprot:TRINITY_DN8794_c0_g1_i1.p1 TRINITY_DN8794_c0_g1~~TRINITY_DN8794_c0_g1_i1.p1  ORF type:complete len:474 (-),score=93.88 TRINITY_DN8794_c0_g1_i1:128-1549(-)